MEPESSLPDFWSFQHYRETHADMLDSQEMEEQKDREITATLCIC
jgi:hypothetical protein